MTKILVFGNEKGGAGKSTLAIHTAVGLLLSRQRILCIDIDIRQKTLHRFFQNRQATAKSLNLDLAMPRLADFGDDIAQHPARIQAAHLQQHVQKYQGQVDYILIDCPGTLTPLSESAHQLADYLITPMNDSFIDFDLLAQIEQDGKTIKTVSIYAEMVWKARQARAAQAGKPATDWVVVRNRLPAQEMHNKRRVGLALEQLAKRIGFRLIAGLSDRVVFKELFPRGLTVADCHKTTRITHSLSNIAARQELRDALLHLQPNLALGF